MGYSDNGNEVLVILMTLNALACSMLLKVIRCIQKKQLIGLLQSKDIVSLIDHHYRCNVLVKHNNSILLITVGNVQPCSLQDRR